MKFTPSKDGVERATVRLSLRFTREQLEAIKALAAKQDQTVRDWLECQADLAVEGALCDQGGEYLQRYGKGDA